MPDAARSSPALADERYDALIVGAGPAGLSAALVLGRARRRVLVLDGGPPRNAAAHASHGFLTRDGASPEELIATAREEIGRYDSVTFRAAVAVDASSEEGGFVVMLDDGAAVQSRLILLASGVRDLLPEVPGLAWGPAVHVCAYCHGWEVRDQPLALLGSRRTMFERAALLLGWSTDLTVLLDDHDEADETTADATGATEAIERLRALGIRVVTDPVTRVEERGDGLRFHHGEAGRVDVSAVFVPATQEGISPLTEALGCIPMESASGFTPYLRTNASGETTTSGVYAAGDLLGGVQSVSLAVGSGSHAAYMMNRVLAMAEARARLALDGGGTP